VAHVYNASEKDAVEDPLEEKKKALDHYKQAREVCGRATNRPLHCMYRCVLCTDAVAPYPLCIQVIMRWIEFHSAPDADVKLEPVKQEADAHAFSSSSTSGSSSDAVGDAEAAARKEKEKQLADKTDLADTLQETIDALAAEIDEVSVLRHFAGFFQPTTPSANLSLTSHLC
jgi:hypothetical protein